MSSNNVGHLITSTITTLQHFATLHHTSPNYTSLHLSTYTYTLSCMLTAVSLETLVPFRKTLCHRVPPFLHSLYSL